MSEGTHAVQGFVTHVWDEFVLKEKVIWSTMNFSWEFLKGNINVSFSFSFNFLPSFLSCWCFRRLH
jgi:hypothetical protein